MTTITNTNTTSASVGGPFGTTGAALSMWDPVTQRSVSINAAEMTELKIQAAFMDFLIEASPHIKEMWIVFNTKERLLK